MILRPSERTAHIFTIAHSNDSRCIRWIRWIWWPLARPSQLITHAHAHSVVWLHEARLRIEYTCIAVAHWGRHCAASLLEASCYSRLRFTRSVSVFSVGCWAFCKRFCGWIEPGLPPTTVTNTRLSCVSHGLQSLWPAYKLGFYSRSRFFSLHYFSSWHTFVATVNSSLPQIQA